MSIVPPLRQFTRHSETLSPARYAVSTGLLAFGCLYLFWVLFGPYTLWTAVSVAGIPAGIYTVVSYALWTMHGRSA